MSRGLRKPVDLITKCTDMGVPDPTDTAEEFQKVSLDCSEQQEESLLTSEPLSYVKQRSCLQKGSAEGRENRF